MIFKTTKPKLKHYNIPPTDENHELLRKAKAAIAASHPGQALELLSTLKLKTLDVEITALSARLADLERTQRFGTESYDTETREHNKINKSIILLINALYKEIAQSFEFYDKIRVALKSRYEARLSQKLSNRQPVNLRLVPSTAGTTPQAANTFVQYDEGQIRGKLAEYYQDANGRLLLVGVPGAGKTTLLLQLELELLEKEITRIPVILNLARWSSTFLTLADWIQEILPSEMGLTINKKIATDLVAQNRLILLLDGLDEVKEEDRQVCLEAIGAYGEDASRYFILSSRIDEYKTVAKDAPVNGQVEVGTLSYEQLMEQLEKTEQNEGSKRLLAAFKEDVFLREIAEVPFYFNSLQLLFARGKYLHEFNFSAHDIKGRKKEIKQCFVSEMFRKINAKGYDAQSITNYLDFFASRLKRENLVDFELIHLQYSWCRLSKWEAIIGKFLEGLVEGMLQGLLAGLLVGLTVGLVAGAAFGLLGGMTIGIAFSLFFGIIYGMFAGMALGVFENLPIIKINDNIKWSWSTVLNKEKLIQFMLGHMFAHLLGSLPAIKTIENIKWDWRLVINRKAWIKRLVTELDKGLIIGLGGSLIWAIWIGKLLVMSFVLSFVLGFFLFFVMGFVIVYGLFLSIFDQLLDNNHVFIQINDPYQRFRASAKMLYFSILQNWHLRHILHKKGLLPKKLVPFLNDMVKCNILETTGASWRFRHRILQDYFADQWVETEFEPEQK